MYVAVVLTCVAVLCMSLGHASWYPCVHWGMYWKFHCTHVVSYHCCCLAVLHWLHSTHLLALCLCYIGDIVCNLVLSIFMSLWLSMLVCILWRNCLYVVLLCSGVLLIKFYFVSHFAWSALLYIEGHLIITTSVLLDSVFCCHIPAVICVRSLVDELCGFIHAVVSAACTCLREVFCVGEVGGMCDLY